MHSRMILRLATVVALAAGGALVSAQTPLLPSSPKLGFGASVTPAYDGWYDNADGSHTFLIGYYNRNWTQDVDIPIGPNNKFEPGDPDRGQPTHFLPNRNFGMFLINRPKETPATDRLWWVITVNGVQNRVPFWRSADFNITVNRSSEEAPSIARDPKRPNEPVYNAPPVLKFAANGPVISDGPYAQLSKASSRTATANTPMPLEIFAEDDAFYTSGTNAPMIGRVPPILEATVAKYRGDRKSTRLNSSH